jgi:aminopeptidase N
VVHLFPNVYKKGSARDFDIPLFVNTEYLIGGPYYSNSYPKAAMFFKMLHDLLDDDVFMDCLHTFVDRWKGKHPTPYDLIFTFEDVSGEYLSWFIKPWLFEYGYVDFELTNFEYKKGLYRASLNKIGHYPAPIDIKIIYKDGGTEVIHKTAKIWKNDNKTYIFEKKSDNKIVAFELLNKLGLDADD